MFVYIGVDPGIRKGVEAHRDSLEGEWGNSYENGTIRQVRVM